MKVHYSKQIAQAVQTFLVDQEWQYEFNEEQGTFKFGIMLNGRLRAMECLIHIFSTDLIIYGLIPAIGANAEDPEEMNEMLRFLTMANYKLRNGNFEMDCSDGEIRYKCFIDCRGLDAPTQKMIRNALVCTANMFDRFGRGILNILFADMDAQEAMALCDTSPAQTADATEIPAPVSGENPEEDDSDLWALLKEMRADDHMLDPKSENEE